MKRRPHCASHSYACMNLCCKLFSPLAGVSWKKESLSSLQFAEVPDLSGSFKEVMLSCPPTLQMNVRVCMSEHAVT